MSSNTSSPGVSASTCARCGRKASSLCARCKRVAYCSQDCQVAHWRSGHKGQCQQWTKGAAEALAPPSAAQSEPKAQTSTPSAALKPSNPNTNPNTNTNTSATKANASAGAMPPLSAAAAGDALASARVHVSRLSSYKEARVVSFRETGLKNVGNTCFVNATLQAMLGSRALVTHLLYASSHGPCAREKDPREGVWCAHCVLRDLCLSLVSGQYAHVTPVAILRAFPRLGDFQLGAQADAHELWMSLMDQLQTSQSPSLPVMDALFSGSFRSVVRCVCGHALERRESFNHLTLELPASAFSLEEALAAHFEIERLDDYKCERCGVKDSGKQLLVHTPPPLLVLQLKRFDMRTQLALKINKSVVFAEHLDLTKHCVDRDPSASGSSGAHYSLSALVVHYGDALWSGHYASFVYSYFKTCTQIQTFDIPNPNQNPTLYPKIAPKPNPNPGSHRSRQDDGWRCYDDERVTRLPNASVALQQDPYLLFYERVPAPSNPLASSSGLTSSLSTSSSSLSVAIVRASVHAALACAEPVVVMRLELSAPLTPSALSSLRVRVTPQGSLSLVTLSSVSSTPMLRYTLPLSLRAHEAEARAEGSLLIVRVPLTLTGSETNDSNDSEPSSSAELELEVRVAPVAELLLDAEDSDELEVAPQWSSEQRLASAQAAVARANVATRSVGSYSQLYKSIEAAWERAKSSPDQAERAYVPPAEASVGRNDPCPCCSGRKFKQCHGAVTGKASQ